MFRLCIPGLLLLLLLAIGGCGSDDDDSSGTPPVGDDDASVGDDDTAPGDDDATLPDETPPPTPDTTTATPRPPRPTPVPETPTPTPEPPPVYDLSAPVEVIYDDAGVPHIYAQTFEDAVWAEGYAQARDRMWQMDYNRRAAKGELAEVLGAGYVNSDLGARTMDLRGLAGQVLETLPTDDPELLGVLQAFSAGVNAYLEAAIAGKDGASLSPQIEALGYVPAPWYPVDTLAIEKALTYDLSSTIDIELNVGIVSSALDPEIVADLVRPQPMDDAVIVPDFYAGMGSPAEARIPAKLETGITREQAERYIRQRPLAGLKQFKGGSNNWVVSGSHTTSGYPLLANDTHQGVNSPATYYQVHLNTADQGGDVDVMGYTFAGAPGVVFGHNRHAAWGVTNNFADVTDLYLEEVRGNQVLFNNDWVEMEARRETIKVRQTGGTVEDAGDEPYNIRVVPHHGPVLPRELIGDLPLTVSVRWTGARPVTAFRCFLDMQRAQSVEDFRAALSKMRVGAQNWVFANIDGDIAYSAHTDIPIREQLDPAYPPYSLLPGSGGYEWTGAFVPDEMIPHTVNPDVGFIASANNDPSGNVQDNDPFNDPYYLSAIYDQGSRARRITDRLIEKTAAGGITMDDMANIQSDNYSQYASHFVPYVLEAATNRPDLVAGNVADAIDILEVWDYRTSDTSSASLLYHTWLAYLLRYVFADETIDALYDELDADYINMLSRPLAYFLSATRDNIAEIEAGQAAFPSISGLNYFDDQNTANLETRDDLLLQSLRDAAGLLVGRYGAASEWTWAAHHTITFNDPAEPWIAEASSEAFPIDGGYFTVDVAEFKLTSGGQVLDPFDVNNGPSQRTIYSVEPDKIVVWDILPGGQSERPGDSHFNDQLQRYVDNDYRVRPFYRTDVDAHQETRWTFDTDGNLSSL